MAKGPPTFEKPVTVSADVRVAREKMGPADELLEKQRDFIKGLCLKRAWILKKCPRFGGFALYLTVGPSDGPGSAYVVIGISDVTEFSVVLV